MRSVIWACMVGFAVLSGVYHASLAESDLTQRVVLAYPALIVWALWSVGYLFGSRRRASTLAFFASVSRLVRHVRVMSARRRAVRSLRD